MKATDEALRQRVRQSWQRDDIDEVPPFDKVWRHAEARHRALRRQYARLAVIAVALAVIAVIFGTRSTVDEPQYIEMAELLNSTYWAAPSDVLLPQREFDIYQDLPELFEST